MVGTKMEVASEVWQTMLHSMGVTDMLRKPCLVSKERPLRASSENVDGVAVP